MRRRVGLRRGDARLALLGAVAACFACGDATAPIPAADVAGTYVAQTIRGHALPWADTSATDATRSQVIWYGERLVLRADSTVVDVATYQYRGDPGPRTDSTTGRWVLNPPATDDETDAPEPTGADVLRTRYVTTVAHSADLEQYYRVEDGGRRIVSLGGGGPATDVYARE